MTRRKRETIKTDGPMGHGQQAIWNAIRAKPEFTITDLWGVVDMHRKSIINYVQRLKAGGYVECDPDFENNHTYRLIKNTGEKAPRLTRDGHKVVQGNGNKNMWRAMRMLAQFSPLDLVAHACTEDTVVGINTAKAFCTALNKAGYLRVVKKAQPPVHQAVYRLINNTGPEAPQIRRVKQVYDPNLDQVMYTASPRS